MNERIRTRLGELESEYGFRIVYACESGSRAWGFASADSDYDVRFVFVWPRDRYLGVALPPETFDFGIDEELIDLSGWDLRKALRLFRKSNASVTEWLFSPIVYCEEEALVGRWRDLVASVFTPKASAAHYAGLAKNMWSGISAGDSTTAKTYLYALRAVLGAKFVLAESRPVPVLFEQLAEGVEVGAALRGEIDAMIAEKAGGSESDGIARSAGIDGFIERSLAELTSALDVLESRVPPGEDLDELFRDALRV